MVGDQMTDLTLEDLAGAATGGDEPDTDDAGAASGESLLELVEFMDERGYLKPLMFGIDAGGDDGEPIDRENTAGQTEVELNAETIAALADRIVESRVGDVPISRIGEFAQSNPEKVNQIIENL